LVFVSQAPLEKLQAYKRYMGWSFPWISSARIEFNFDLGFSHTAEQGREAVALMTASGLPPIVEHNTRSTRTDVVGYLTESPGFSAFARDDDTVFHSYATTWRGWNFSWATTRSSTAHRKAATRAKRGSSGSAGTTSTRARVASGLRVT